MNKDIKPFTDLFDDLPDQIEAHSEAEKDKIRTRKERDALVETAYEFLNSVRGRYIMAQALNVAIRTMSDVPDPHKEQSNINDMEFLRDYIFNFPITSNEDMREIFEKLTKEKNEHHPKIQN